MRISLLILLTLVALSVRARDALSICYDDWSPYAAFNSSEGHHGLTVDLLREVFGARNISLRFQSATQSRCVAAARAGKIDVMLFGDNETLPKWRLTSTPTEFWLIAAWVPSKSPIPRFDGLAQFRGARVGMVKDYIYPEPIERFSQWKKVSVGDAIDGLRQLSARRIDLMLEDVFWTKQMQRRHQLQIRMLKPLVATMPQFHAYRPELAPLFAEFDHEVQRRIKNGEMDLRYRSAIGVSYDAVRRGAYASALD